MDSKPLSVLVTGSSGFIGTHFVRHLHSAGHRVTALGILKPNFHCQMGWSSASATFAKTISPTEPSTPWRIFAWGLEVKWGVT